MGTLMNKAHSKQLMSNYKTLNIIQERRGFNSKALLILAVLFSVLLFFAIFKHISYKSALVELKDSKEYYGLIKVEQSKKHWQENQLKNIITAEKNQLSTLKDSLSVLTIHKYELERDIQYKGERIANLKLQLVELSHKADDYKAIVNYSTEVTQLQKQIIDLKGLILDLPSPQPKQKQVEGDLLLTANSVVLRSVREVAILREWLNLPRAFENFEFKIIYKHNVNEEHPNDSFHMKCDNIPHTIILIKITDGDVIGGYTAATWDGRGFKQDASAFLFNLSTKTKYAVRDPDKAIFAHPVGFACFGENDMSINNHNVIINFPSSYGSAHDQTLLNSKETFVVIQQFEVLQVVLS